MSAIRRIVITPGEPAGIGPDLTVSLAMSTADIGRRAELVAVADPDMLSERAALLGCELRVDDFDPARAPAPNAVGAIKVLPVRLANAAAPGKLDPANARYVLTTLEKATEYCMQGKFDALTTGPVQKSVINDAGITFSGHTEFLAGRTGGYPVMMLVAAAMRVALVTTHLPLREVSGAITRERLSRVIRALNKDLRERFAIERPRIFVCGLNPHAGESGHLGREEIEIIAPALDALRREDITLVGPLPADTLFVPGVLAEADAVLAMYHDQGLPVLKHAGFGAAVNVTLGLPIIRTSVDHGTAVDLAGTGKADAGSMRAALELAYELAA
ncbi:MAG: 4-hydroxythreonine-4-phosphate dehydrogenase PdxA [Gammaproteobacteria bacterium]